MRGTGTLTFYKAMVVAVAAFCLIVVGFESLRPHANAAVAVVFPPWVDADTAGDRVAEAGGHESSAGRYPFVAFVPESSPSFRLRVRKQGALFVLDADRFGSYLSAPKASL